MYTTATTKPTTTTARREMIRESNHPAIGQHIVVFVQHLCAWAKPLPLWRRAINRCQAKRWYLFNFLRRASRRHQAAKNWRMTKIVLRRLERERLAPTLNNNNKLIIITRATLR